MLRKNNTYIPPQLQVVFPIRHFLSKQAEATYEKRLSKEDDADHKRNYPQDNCHVDEVGHQRSRKQRSSELEPGFPARKGMSRRKCTVES